MPLLSFSAVPAGRLRRSLLLFVVLLAGTACHRGPGTRAEEGVIPYPQLPVGFSVEQMDSLLQRYPSPPVKEFYRRRALHFAWIDTTGANEYARNFMNFFLHNNAAYGTDTFPYGQRLRQLYMKSDGDEDPYGLQPGEAAELEWLLTACFFDYVRKNWKGLPDERIREASWFITRPPVDAGALLDSLLRQDARMLAVFQPVIRQYALLKGYLAAYSRLTASWPAPPARLGALRSGDSSSAVPAVKELLFLSGDFPSGDRSLLFTGELDSAFRRFQRRHGLPESGWPDSATVRQLSVPLRQRLETILLNMERCRWLPGGQQGDFLVVNIPDFRLLAFAADTLHWSTRVIVGETQATHRSVIFSDYLETIVFNPSWSVPRSILVKEILPAVRRRPDYLKQHHMVVTDGNGRPVPADSIDWNQDARQFPYRIRQVPGPDNALGRVKFLFPNTYSIYLHDTPSKSLFEESRRTFSHGCIRVEDPFRLVHFLLRGDSAWTATRVDSILDTGKETAVRLPKHIPVFITYFTAWVGRDGRLNFRDDIYGHDQKLKSLLFQAGE